ncbi:unnamed protein product [Echinostoma caproni]|uniref:rRNA methyltransferase 2, mitochondrial n=1 Tax=Echinostoma caproni TaxID=27848 RepID=A0A183A0H4_9TREM|nr:unnamed protein product [Echinostoma caproni]
MTFMYAPNLVIKGSNLKAESTIIISLDFGENQEKRWLGRQRADPFVRRARLESFRCRSAFKLIQLHEGVPGGLIHPGDVVLDCGAAPGSWTQVATAFSAGPPAGLVIAFDLLDFSPVPGAHCYPQTDVLDWEKCARLVDQAIAAHKDRGSASNSDTQLMTESVGVNVVLSDMAPNASGIREIDIPAMMNLASAVLQVRSSLDKYTVPEQFGFSKFRMRLGFISFQTRLNRVLQRFAFGYNWLVRIPIMYRC